MRVEIPRSIIKIFIDKALESDVEECGLLIGYKKEGIYSLRALFIGMNIDRSKVSFTLDPYTIMSAYEYSERYGMDVLATIHSHPAPPRPSSMDLNNMSIWRIPWIIVDSTTGNFDIWIYEDGLRRLEYILVG